MKLFLSLSMAFGLIALSQQSVDGQSLKDTLRIKTVEIIGRKKADKFEQQRSEVDSIALSKSRTVRLSELLSQNTPLFIKEYGRGAMATASFRGTAPSHTKVSWNGLELNSPMLGMVDFSLIPVYFTEEVKLLHGSSSLTESAGALGGTILLDNSANWSNTFSGKLLSGYGSYGTLDEFVQINLGNRKFQSKSAFFYNASQNDFPFINKLNATLDPVTGNYSYSPARNKNGDYKNYGFLQELYLQTGINQNFSLKTWLQHNERSIPQLLTNESNESANINRQTENALRSVAEYKKFGPKYKWTLYSAINVQNSVYRLENKVSGAPDQLVMDSNAKILSFANKLSYRHQFDASFFIETGAEVVFQSVNSENRLSLAPNSGYDKNRFENSLYATLEKQFGLRWNAVFLLRESWIDLVHKDLLPLLRINFRPYPGKSFHISGSLAQNSHQPTLNDLYFIPGGNPTLKPEKGLFADLGASYDFSVSADQFHIGLSSFASQVRDWIIWLPTYQGYWEPANMDQVKSRGLEANVVWKGSFRGIRYGLRGNYAYTATTNQSIGSSAFGKQLPYIPVHSANLNFNLAFAGYELDWMWNYYSKRFTTTANSEDTASDYIYPYIMNNFQLSKLMYMNNNILTVEIKILNIFNEDYRTVLQRPMPGRNYQLVVRYDF